MRSGTFPRVRPRNQVAYDYFLRGLRAANLRLDEQGFNEALADFQHALEADPTFAPAAVGRGRVLVGLADFGYVPPEQGYPQAREAAHAALKLDPKSSVAHALLASVYLEYDWDWSATERELKLAQELEPHNPIVLQTLAQYRMSMGPWPEATRLIVAILATDPLNQISYMFGQWIYQRAGRFAEAEASGRRVLEITPIYGWAHFYLAISLLAEGKSDAALAEMRKETVPAARDSGLVVVYCTLKRKKDAEAALAHLAADSRWPMGLAYAYAALARNDQAFAFLDEAYDQRDSSLWSIKGDPLLKTLEHDPRYTAFLRKMNLPE